MARSSTESTRETQDMQMMGTGREEAGIRHLMIGLGEILWDLLPGGKQLGGAPANFAYHAHALGARGLPVSRIGDDELGREIVARLSDVDLPVEYVAVDADHPTGTVSVELDADGKPTYIIHENVAWDHLEATAKVLELAAAADAVCFGSLGQRHVDSRSTILRILAATRPDCLRVFDVNLRQDYYGAEILRGSLEHANVLKLNDEELPIVCGLVGIEGNERDMMDRLLLEFSLCLVAVTRGAEGAWLATVDEFVEVPGAQLETIADTVGAGDAFTAAMVTGLLRGDGLETIATAANRLAAYVCTQPGAMPPPPAPRT
jgi:fructokinase